MDGGWLMPERLYSCQCKQSRPFDFAAHFPDDVRQAGKLTRLVIGLHFCGKFLPQLFFLKVQEYLMHPKQVSFRHAFNLLD